VQVFLGRCLSGVAGCGLEGDAGCEDAPEVRHAKEQDEQHREDKGKFDERLSPDKPVLQTTPWPPQISQ
jgi:hypothetical protein